MEKTLATYHSLKGTTVPYFKIGKSGITLYQGSSDPTGSYTVEDGDWWFDINALSLKVRDSSSWVSTNSGGGSSDPFAVVVQTTAATLTAGAVNELQTSNTFTLPLANSVSAGDSIIMELSDKYAAFVPVVQRGGSDNIAYSGGTDTSFTFDSGTLSIRMISNGTDEWRL